MAGAGAGTKPRPKCGKKPSAARFARPLRGAEVLVAVRGPSPGEGGGKKRLRRNIHVRQWKYSVSAVQFFPLKRRQKKRRMFEDVEKVKTERVHFIWLHPAPEGAIPPAPDRHPIFEIFPSSPASLEGRMSFV